MKRAADNLSLPITLKADETIRALVYAAGIRGYSFACWQLPHSQQKHVLIDTGDKLIRGDIDLEHCKRGFVVGPFTNKDLEETIFLQADIYFNTEMSGPETLQSGDAVRQDNAQNLLQNLEPANAEQKPIAYHVQPYEANITGQEEFEELVSKAMAEIKAGHMLKVVPSRAKDIDIYGNNDVLRIFSRINEFYPAAFGSLISLPGVGTWLGASPEPLIQLGDSSTFRTVALAGTQKAEPEKNLADIAWTQKEIEEQALVSRYIINSFKKIRLREFEEHGPRTIQAGNLIHLMTSFEVDMEAVNFPQLGSVMLKLLHPTSAVCGMPLEHSKDFISNNEHYDRSLYSGFLGPVNINTQTNIYVNLRCMQFFEKQVRIYAGAGVTEHSIPAKEWQETEDKCQTMLNLLD